MSSEYFVVCPNCHMTLRTTSNIGSRVKCRREKCGKTFIVTQKFRTKEDMERVLGVKCNG
jgi:hypothetical protein